MTPPPDGNAAYRLTRAAADDIRAILKTTGERFGPLQRRAYAGLIGQAARTLAARPETPGSRARPELGPAVRSCHLDTLAGRRGAAAHVVDYRRATGEIVVILRVLHHAMEPGLHLDAASKSGS